MDDKTALREKQLTERFKVFHLAGYSYFDTPDGEDLFLKLLYTSKFAFVGGVWCGLLDATAGRPPAVGNKAKLLRVLKPIIPFVTISAAVTTSIYLATRYRKKDDEVNYVIGGAVGGVLVGALTQWPLGLGAVILFSGLGFGIKTQLLQFNSAFGRPERRNFSSYYARKLDFSLLPDNIRGNWSKELPKSG